jgi:Flp pilus assembly protein TadG
MRQAKGNTILELATISGLLVVVALLCADIGIVSMGAAMNDQACRDACRAAAQASNMTEATNMARASLKAHTADGYFVTTPSITPGGLVYQDFGGNAPPDTSPYVEVSTRNTVRIPAPVLFFGAKFGQGGTMNFTKKYTFPIVRTTLYL